jgi:hypothetical protein
MDLLDLPQQFIPTAGNNARAVGVGSVDVSDSIERTELAFQVVHERLCREWLARNALAQLGRTIATAMTVNVRTEPFQEGFE